MKKGTRILAAAVAAVMLMLSGTALADAKIQQIGALTMLNISEADYAQIVRQQVMASAFLCEDQPGAILAKEGFVAENPEIIYFDHLTDLVMALQAGQIQAADLPMEVAMYVAAHNDGLQMISPLKNPMDILDLDNVMDILCDSVFCCDLSFMTTEENSALLAEINRAAMEIYEDGTEDQLYETYVINAMENEPVVEDIQPTEGWEIIRVIVTGDLPPIDYMTADGKPAGFNVALLREIGKRLQKNIELIPADAASRSLLLSSGEADIAFWTRSSADLAGMADLGVAYDDWEQFYELGADEQATVDEINEKVFSSFNAEQFTKRDLPEGLTTGNDLFLSTVNTLLVNESALR